MAVFDVVSAPGFVINCTIFGHQRKSLEPISLEIVQIQQSTAFVCLFPRSDMKAKSLPPVLVAKHPISFLCFPQWLSILYSPAPKSETEDPRWPLAAAARAKISAVSGPPATGGTAPGPRVSDGLIGRARGGSVPLWRWGPLAVGVWCVGPTNTRSPSWRTAVWSPRTDLMVACFVLKTKS